MCGIAGFLDFKGSRVRENPGKILRNMLDALRHRGPDDRGEERLTGSDGTTLYLGHQRLSVIDLSSRAHQPMGNESKNLWISANCEIYNFKDLREKLRPKHDFFSESDTEVLLKSYQEWGVDCLERLRGMFSFAVWDSGKQRLFLARDRLGIKPLYYVSGPDFFLFASELRALQASGLVFPTINTTGLFNYLSFGSSIGPDTLVSDIREVPPAHFLTVQPGGVSEKKYWDLLKFRSPQGSPVGIGEERVRQTLVDSVGLRLVSDVPLGAFLSGGVDSSAVVSLVKEHTSAAFKTISVVFREQEYDESQFSRLVAREFETDHQTMELDGKELLRSLPQAVSAMDQPTVDGINTYLISRCAKKIGLKVALSGLGGDELFGGYDSFRWIPRLSRLEAILGALPRSLPLFLGKCLQALLPACDRNNKLVHFFRGQKSGSHVYFLVRALLCLDRVRTLFADPDLAENEIRKNLESTQNLTDSLSHLDPMDQITWLELNRYLTNTLLRDTDMMSMAHGLEVRVPLIDHKLVELVFSIPSRIKMKGNLPKPLLLRSLSRKLPIFAVNRKKMGFTLPFEFWMRNELKKEIETVLFTPVAPLSGLLSEAGIRRIWSDFLARRTTWSRPWALYVLKKWVHENL